MEKDYYIHIESWMVQKLKLSGNELLTYAIVYGFSQDGESMFLGSSKYISYALSVSRPTAIKTLNNLTEKGLIIKSQEKVNDVVFNRYKVNLQAIKKIDNPYKETLQGGYKDSLQGGYKDSLHSNKYKEINNKEINNSNIGETTHKPKSNKFVAPTVEEVKAYCTERGNVIDPERFVDYYEARGWMSGKNHIKDWKACVRTWERNTGYNNQSNDYKPKKQEQSQDTSDFDECINEDGSFDIEKYINNFYEE